MALIAAMRAGGNGSLIFPERNKNCDLFQKFFFLFPFFFSFFFRSGKISATDSFFFAIFFGIFFFPFFQIAGVILMLSERCKIPHPKIQGYS